MTTRSGITQSQREDVLARDEYRCVRDGELIRGYDYSIQHRKARGMGGSRYDARMSALITLCGSATTGCHGWVEANPAAAREAGYRVPDGTDPELWPVLWRGLSFRYLTDDGWAPLPTSEGVTTPCRPS